MSLANRHIIAKKISDKTGYFKQDIEEILEAEEQAIAESIEEGYSKIKTGKLYQIEISRQNSKEIWDGIRGEYYRLPERNKIKIKPLNKAKKIIEKLNNELDNKE